MNQQLTLFEPLNIERANDLLAMLNMDRKKDLFLPHSTFQYGNYSILIAQNKEYGQIFNIVDELGNIPQGFCACWRVFHHIKQELNLK